MAPLEALQSNLRVRGIIPDQTVTVITTVWHGLNAVEVIFKQADGKLDSVILYRDNEANLEMVAYDNQWAFDVDGTLLRLVSEAYRINLAHLFDPILAVHTSLIEPLPHQITAVYDEMLTRHPLRFLLADDPGAGKTIMAGLLIRELVVRGDVRRCLICVPGSLTEQWQDELWAKFQLDFAIMSRDKLETSRSGNPFVEQDLIIVRLDQLSRSEDLQVRLQQTDWDLVVCDEAHKMSASFFGGDLKETKRYKLGKLLGEVSRHFLLMTATPHNGKEEDFQLFLALLDADRFEGRFRDGVHHPDVSDLMRRMVKEKLLKFDGKPLFPERRAYTVNYTLSPEEDALYEDVTEYVQQEFNRAEQLENEGRKGTVGFALTILQRQLASSPEAIYQSLKRRRDRLEKRLSEAKRTRERIIRAEGPDYDEDYWDDMDDAPDAEVEALETELIDSATAARTVEELEAEIISLRDLEAQALRVRRSGNDRKWNELLRLLQDTPEMQNAQHQQRKQVDANCKRTEETLVVRLQETYSWLIVPVQPDPTGPIEYQAHRIAGQDSFYDRAARKLRQGEMLIPRWSPDNLRMELDNYLWRDQPHLGVKQLWEYLARYCYLPRLYDEEVLFEAIKDGATRTGAPFGYATMVDSNGELKGLVFGRTSSSIYFDDNSVLVRSEIAQELIDRQQQQSTSIPSTPVSPSFERASVNPNPVAPIRPKLTTRYHGTVLVDPQRVNREMATIVEEIIQRLTSLTGTNVEITLEISAERQSGFDDATVRTINENSRTLKFRNHGFEEG